MLESGSTPAQRGATLLVAHCEAVGRMTGDALPGAYERLEAELGCDLARRLVDALSGEKPMRAPFWISQAEVA